MLKELELKTCLSVTKGWLHLASGPHGPRFPLLGPLASNPGAWHLDDVMFLK